MNMWLSGEEEENDQFMTDRELIKDVLSREEVEDGDNQSRLSVCSSFS